MNGTRSILKLTLAAGLVLLSGRPLLAATAEVPARSAAETKKRSIVWTRTEAGMVRVIYDEADRIVSQRSYGEVPFQRYHSIRRGSPDRLEVALTFDTGNLSQTEFILDVLKEKKVKATFFLSNYPHLPGSYRGTLDAERVGPLLRRMVAEGHEIGNHTWNHFDLVAGKDPGGKPVAVTAALVLDELRRVEKHVRSLCGADLAPMWRPPFGSTNLLVNRWASEAGYPYSIGWTEGMDSLDWMTKYSAEETLKRLKEGTIPGGIYLFHMGCDKRQDDPVARILPDLIDWLRGEGYRCVAVSELVDQLWLLKEQKMLARAEARPAPDDLSDAVSSDRLYRVDEGPGGTAKVAPAATDPVRSASSDLLARLRSRLLQAGTEAMAAPAATTPSPGADEPAHGRSVEDAGAVEEAETEAGEDGELSAAPETRLVRLFRARKAARLAVGRSAGAAERSVPSASSGEGEMAAPRGETSWLSAIEPILAEVSAIRFAPPRETVFHPAPADSRLVVHPKDSSVVEGPDGAVASVVEGPDGAVASVPAVPDGAVASVPAVPDGAVTSVPATRDVPSASIAQGGSDEAPAEAVAGEAASAREIVAAKDERPSDPPAPSPELGKVAPREPLPSRRDLEKKTDLLRNWIARSASGPVLGAAHDRYAAELEIFRPRPSIPPEALRPGGVGLIWVGDLNGDQVSEVVVDYLWSDSREGPPLHLPVILVYGGVHFELAYGVGDEPVNLRIAEPVKDPDCGKLRLPLWFPGRGGVSLALVGWRPEVGAFGRDVVVPCPLPLDRIVEAPPAPEGRSDDPGETDGGVLAGARGVVTADETRDDASVPVADRPDPVLAEPRRRQWLRELSGFCRWQDFVDRRSDNRLAAPPAATEGAGQERGASAGEGSSPPPSQEPGSFRDRESVRAVQRYLNRLRTDVFPADQGKSE